MTATDGMQADDWNGHDCFRTCYECDHPVQLSGLYAGGCFARLSRDEYFACRWADYDHAQECVRRQTGRETELVMKNLMRERFDLIVEDLERSTGIRLDAEYAEDLLTRWYEGRKWQHCAATRRNLPWMLFYPGHDSIDRALVRRDSELYRKLSTIGFIRLEDEPPCHARVVWVKCMWKPIWFELWRRRTIIRDGRSYDTYRLRLWVDGLPLGDDLSILADDHYLDAPPSRRDQRLLGIAEKVLGKRGD